MHLLVMVLDDSTKLDLVLQAWQDAGVRGVTILDSTGIHRILKRTVAHPAMTRFGAVFGTSRVGHNTLLAVVESLEIAEAVVANTESVLGNLDKPNTGIIFAVPVAKTWGIPEGEEPDWGHGEEEQS